MSDSNANSSDDSSVSGFESQDESTGTTPSSENSEEVIGKQESLHVWRWKLLVIVMMLFTGALVVTSSYIFLSREEEDEFKVAYEQSADAILNSAEISTAAVMSSLFTMADAITAEAELVNQTWPFVTSRHFEIKGTHARGDSRTEIILFAPLVSNSMRSEWERYSVKNQDWLSESAMLDGAASALEMADEAPTDGHDGHDMGHNEDEAHDGMNHDAGHDGDSNNGMNRDSDMQHVGDTGMEHDSEMQHGGSTGMEHDSGMEHGSGMEHEASGGLEHDSDIEHNASGGMDYGPGMGHEGDGGMQHDSGIEHNVGGGMEHEGNGGVEHDYGMEHNANGGAENDTGIEHEGNGGMEHDSAMDHEASGGMENDPGMDHEGSGNEDNVVEDGATMQHEDNGGMRHGRRHLQMDHGMDHSSHSTQGNDQPKSKTGISEKLYFFADDGKVVRAKDVPLHAPIWQLSPLPKLDHSVVNFDLMMDDSIQRTVNRVVKSALTSSVSEVADFDLFFNSVLTMGEHMTYHSDTHNARHGEFHGHGHPHSVVVAPVKGGFGENSEVVGVVVATLAWDFYFTQVLPESIRGIHAVLQNSCGQVYTYVVRGKRAEFLGVGDFHESKYNDLRRSFSLNDILQETNKDDGHCEFSIHVYPSTEFRETYNSRRPEFFTVGLAAAILATGVVFVVFVVFVQRRQRTVMATARRTNMIVSSIFPSNVRDRIMKDAEKQARQEVHGGETQKRMFDMGNKSKLKNFLSDGPGDARASEEGNVFGSKPIADLFPATTILFADLCGFTAWSSVREPSQVFTLLETIYHEFDQIAKRRRVFKVETVGDCYVAVCGLPDPRKDHAAVMARFANECSHKVNELTKKLEVVLGPDTGDLGMRFGLHSGPVTAGVLRGERARFQLFGDTMNTASRMESTGVRDRIHISAETAKLLQDSGKHHWVVPREDKVIAKGKGELATYWLHIRKGNYASSERGSMANESSCGGSSLEDIEGLTDLSAMDDKTRRLVKWNTELILGLLKQIVAHRKAIGKPVFGSPRLGESRGDKIGVIDEVKEIIMLPEFEGETLIMQVNPQDIVFDQSVEDEVADYVTTIAMLYRGNSFHNFEHASHVTMSVTKLLSRIVAPSDLEIDHENNIKKLHDHTYGITSDPLTQFACVLSALIHDVDHCGVPNSQLIKEDSQLAHLYEGKSVAEQNSVDISWSLLCDSRFQNFRKTIFATEDEYVRFRALVVNSVMATDIMDKDLKALRNSRWDKAFAEAAREATNSRDNINRKATIVIEHIIQASDVSHTMQHWHIYRKWNERLFNEMYDAYKNGRADSDPAENWYKGEIGFFDFYIIPLAKKLSDCGVFGVSSFEYLNYAQRNRDEWEQRGQEVVAEMVAKRKAEEQNQSGNEGGAGSVKKESLEL